MPADLPTARALAAAQCPPDLTDALGRVYPNIQRRAVLSGQYDRGRIVTRFMEAKE
jgi:hypothetical protein